MIDVLIIGGGAAGAAAAIAAAEAGKQVLVLDKNRKALKKLGVTGNGRGNLMNAGQLRYYGDEVFAQAVFEQLPCAAVRRFWEELGVTLAEEDEGRVYPAAYTAAVVTEALSLRMEELGVEIAQNTTVHGLEAVADGFCATATESLYAADKVKAGGKVKKGDLLEEKQVTYTAQKVIVAAGGSAAPVHGTDGSAYRLLCGFGHKLIKPRPALSPLNTDTEPLRGLSGQRIRAELTLCLPNGDIAHQTRGEALFTDSGVSGIAAMQLSRFVKQGAVLRLDMREAVFGDPKIDAGAALEARIHRKAESPLGSLFAGAATPALAGALLRAAGLQDKRRPAGTLNAIERCALTKAITAFALPVTGVKGFEAAQVTAGGIDPGGFDPATMESRLQGGLYAAGEILDVDGDCGGYNLMFATAGGLLAGRAASR